MEHFSRFERQNHEPFSRHLEPVSQTWKKSLCFLAKLKRQLVTLFSVFPVGLLVQIFEALHQNDLVSTETFFQWEKCDDPAHQESKGVAIKSTIPFFTFLKEGEDSSDDSSEDDD